MRTKQDEQIAEILDNIHDELENANHHDEVNIPYDLYHAIHRLVQESDRVELAQRIADIFEENL